MEVFDYNSKTVVNDIVSAFKDRTSAGAFAIGNKSEERCLDILPQCKGERKIMIAMVPMPDPLPKPFILLRVMFTVIPWMASIFLKSALRSTKATFFTATEMMGHEFELEIFTKYLPCALARGDFLCAPEPQVVGNGLEYVQEAIDILGKGVSANKLVVTL
jgi:hypothetical protein